MADVGTSKPKTWQEAAKLVDDPALEQLMRIRLVELIFSQDSTVALQAYDRFIASGRSPLADLLADMGDVQLGKLLEVIAQRLRATDVESGEMAAGDFFGASENT